MTLLGLYQLIADVKYDAFGDVSSNRRWIVSYGTMVQMLLGLYQLIADGSDVVVMVWEGHEHGRV